MLPLRKELFWDIDFNKINLLTHKRIITERVLTLGNLDEFFFLLDAYDRQTLVDEISQIGYLDPKTLSFVISFFNIDKNQLKCYTRIQSMIQHWN
ncbi:MAG: hypothetical protein K9H16_08635 [Bacteroidales bacterium]|nr:hypothetical protein [Bacteroidales bacterium]